MRYDANRRCGLFLVVAAMLAGCGSQSTAASDGAGAGTLAGNMTANAGAGASATAAADEEAVRAIVGGIYGWRDGRPVAILGDWIALFSSRLKGLLAQCETAAENADSQANGGEGPYAVLGDQGCINVPFLTDPMTDDPAPFIRKTHLVLRRAGPDTIEADIAIAPADRKDWWEDTSGQTIRFQRSNGRWLVDEVLTRTSGETQLYSSHLQHSIVELGKIAKKTRRR